MYLGILYPDPALDSDPDHFIIKQKYYGKLNFYYFGTLKNTFLNGFFIGVQKVNDENMRIRIRRTEYASGSGCASRFPDPDQHQKFMDPQHLGGGSLGYHGCLSRILIFAIPVSWIKKGTVSRI
jgi:hypothetical protein